MILLAYLDFFFCFFLKHRSGCKQEPLHFWTKPLFLFWCPAEAKSLSVSSNALPVKDGAPRRSLNLEDYKKRRGLIWCSQSIQNPHCMCNWLYNWESVWECGWEQERERGCVCVWMTPRGHVFECWYNRLFIQTQRKYWLSNDNKTFFLKGYLLEEHCPDNCSFVILAKSHNNSYIELCFFLCD